MKKDQIRLTIKTRKTLLNDDERRSAARRVFDLLASSAPFLAAEKVLFYHSLPDELSTLEFLDNYTHRATKSYYLPRVNGVNLDILPYERSRMHLGAFRIEEPEGTDTVSIDDIDLVIVPAVAFDRHGNRVGRGKGYYDRLLARAKAVKVGVGYSFQLLDEDVDAEPHDVRVDFVITEDGIFRTR